MAIFTKSSKYFERILFASRYALLFIFSMMTTIIINGQTLNIDINGSSSKTETGYTALSGISGSQTVDGTKFTLFGVADGNSRDRSIANELLTDFVFNEGVNNVGIGFRIEDLPQGTYNVRSWHYDASYNNGSINVEFRIAGNNASTQTLVSNFAFSTAPATYQITVDGTSDYELVFREADGLNKSRFNGISIELVEPTIVNIDINTSSDKTESGYIPLTSSSSATTPEGASFDIFGTNTKNYRDRGISNELLTDFVFNDGQNAGVGLRIKDLPQGTYNVRSWHFDGISAYNNGAINVEFRVAGNLNSSQTLVSNFEFSTEPASYQITVDGTNDYDLVFRETGNFNRTRLNAITFESTSSSIINQSNYNIETVADDGIWIWFNDERAIYHNGYLYVGYVLENGDYGVTRYNPTTKQRTESIISTINSRERDDHNNPSFTVLPDGKLLIIYSKHNKEAKYYYRISKNTTPATINDWGPEITETTNCVYTYNNTYQLSSENRIYNYSRCVGFNPSVAYSDDNGQSWSDVSSFIRTSGGRPYFNYTSNHTDRIDLIYTDRHPQETNDNSIYHLYYQDGDYRKSNGQFIKSFNDLPINHFNNERGSVVYQYSDANWGPNQGPDDWIPGGRAWTWDVAHDNANNISTAFQVQLQHGSDFNSDRIYYYYARWNGSTWEKTFIAQGGRSLYSSQRHYGGGMAIDPDNPNVVYISSNAANPFDLSSVGLVPLNSNQRYEIYRGVTNDNGKTFNWEAVTANSTVDNFRPFVPDNHGFGANVLWFRGFYRSFVNFETSVVGVFENDNIGLRSSAVEQNLTTSPKLGYKTEIKWTHLLPKDDRKVATYTIQHYLPKSELPKDIKVISDIDNESELFSYQILHENPQMGENYYQVRIEYEDGTIDYSYPSLVVFSEQLSRLTLAPNPATNVLNLDLTNYKGIELNYFISSLTGQVLLEGVFDKNHTDTESIDIESLLNGNYFIYAKPINGSPITQQFSVMKNY